MAEHEHISLLVLEDNPGDFRLLEAAVESSSLETDCVVHVTTMGEAIEALIACRFDAILVDLSLPDSLGLATAETILAAAPGIAVIVVSGNTDVSMAKKALELGAQDYLEKGALAPDYLVRTIRHAITRQRMQNDLERTNRELEQKTRDLEEFTSVVSHDLKSPLVTIAGFADQILDGMERGDHDFVARSVDVIRRACGQAHDSIAALLQLARVGQIEFRQERVDLDEMMREMHLDLMPRLREAGVTLDVLYSLPQVAGDREWIRHVIENLIGNALKYGCSNAEPVIRIGASSRADQVQVFVEDNGAGIPESALDRIFGVFERASKDAEGSGVGLSICRRIIEEHGGRIWVESIEGRGATFTFTLPSARNLRSAEPVPSVLDQFAA